MPDVALLGAPTDARAPGEAREYDVWCRMAAEDLRAYAYTGPIVSNFEILPSGFDSQAFGGPLVSLGILATGIAPQAFGTAIMGLTVHPSGIDSQAFGSAIVSLYVQAAPEVGASWRRIRRGRKW